MVSKAACYWGSWAQIPARQRIINSEEKGIINLNMSKRHSVISRFGNINQPYKRVFIDMIKGLGHHYQGAE